MKTTIVSIAVLFCLATGGWFLRREWAGSQAHPPARKVLFYQDSMHPWIKSDAPGKCTVCGMDLTPIYEGQAGLGGDNVVVLSSNSVTVLNVQTEEVRRQSLHRTLRVAGTLDANETKKTIVSAPAAGRIEETAVDYAGVEVKKGQRLLTFYSPGLTQQKYRYMARAARSPEQRDPTGGLSIEKGDADPYFTDLIAPLGGTVIERNVSRGQYVSEGERLFTIADASVLWFRFDVYEQQLPWLRVGQKVLVSLPNIPGEQFEAVISFIDPMLDTATRTVKVRADISNPEVERHGAWQRLFKFGMYAEGVVRAEVPNTLAVPRGAVLHPGQSAYAYVDKGGGAFERRLLKLGQQGDDSAEVLGGLEEGDQVVTSGNVLLDAQAQFSQKNAPNDGEPDARDLTPAAVVKLPAAAGMASSDLGGTAPTAMNASRAEAVPPPLTVPAPSNGQKTAAVSQAPTSAIARAHTRMRPAPGTTMPDATSGRMLEGPMFVRMAELRNAELAEARAARAAGTNRFSEIQSQRLQALMSAIAGISQALAADDLQPFQERLAKLPELVSSARQELGDAPPWKDLFDPLAEASKGHPVTTLDEARKQFLSVSTAAVGLARQLRKDEPAFAALKIYHCPMAPKPGLWVQAKGPLANPYFGAAMLTCGEEVR